MVQPGKFKKNYHGDEDKCWGDVFVLKKVNRDNNESMKKKPKSSILTLIICLLCSNLFLSLEKLKGSSRKAITLILNTSLSS